MVVKKIMRLGIYSKLKFLQKKDYLIDQMSRFRTQKLDEKLPIVIVVAQEMFSAPQAIDLFCH